MAVDFCLRLCDNVQGHGPDGGNGSVPGSHRASAAGEAALQAAPVEMPPPHAAPPGPPPQQHSIEALWAQLAVAQQLWQDLYDVYQVDHQVESLLAWQNQVDVVRQLSQQLVALQQAGA